MKVNLKRVCAAGALLICVAPALASPEFALKSLRLGITFERFLEDYSGALIREDTCAKPNRGLRTCRIALSSGLPYPETLYTIAEQWTDGVEFYFLDEKLEGFIVKFNNDSNIAAVADALMLKYGKVSTSEYRGQTFWRWSRAGEEMLVADSPKRASVFLSSHHGEVERRKQVEERRIKSDAATKGRKDL